MPGRLLLCVLLLACLAGPAAAAPSMTQTWPTLYAGRIVRAVQLETPKGVSASQLAYLVEQPIGAPLNPQAIRRSVELLFRLGQFDDVSAHVSPLPDGSVEVVFRLIPSPSIGRLALRGVRSLSASAVRAALERTRGDSYVPGDEARLAQQVEGFYRAHGFLDVLATGAIATAPNGKKAIRIDVEEGRRYRIGAVRFVGENRGFTDRRLLGMLGAAVQPGRFYGEDALRKGLTRLIEQLKKKGFVEARLLNLAGPRRRSRVPIEVRRDGDSGTVEFVVPLDAGHLVEAQFLVEGVRKAGWRDKRLEQVVGLQTAARVSRTYAEDAARQLERFLWRRGAYHAVVDVAVVDEPLELPEGAPSWVLPTVKTVRVLRFEVRTGPLVRLRVSDIKTVGNEYLSRRGTIAILSDGSPEVLGHRPPLFQVLGFDLYERYYTDGELAQAIDVLEDWYRARGYLAASITSSVRFVRGSCREADDPLGHRVCLELTFDEGVRTEVESLMLQTGDAELEPDRVEEWEGRFVGKPFNPAALDDLAIEVQDALADRGFIDARVTTSHELSTDGTLARLGVEVIPGEAVRFGKVVVRESRHTQVGFIRRQISLRPGDLFSRSALQSAQGRLLRTGLFDGIVLQPAQKSGRLRDVEMLVNERKRFSFVLGAGLTWPDDGPRVSGEARLRNLDGRGLSMWARGRASIDWRSITLGVLLPEYRASLGVEVYLPGLPIRTALTGLINEELDEPTYRISRSGVRLGLDWRPSQRLTVSGQAEVQLRAPVRVDSVARLNELTDIPKDRPRQNPSLLTLGTLSAVVDLRDDRFNPTEGAYISATVDSTPGALVPGAPAFGRLSGRFVGLIPLGKGGVGIQLEGAAGIAWSYDGRLPPVEWRFRLGGTSTVRGFRLDSIGPTGKRVGTLESQGLLGGGPERQVPVGGNAFYRYSVQVLLPMPGLKGWRLAVFHDAGNALIYGAVPDNVDAGRAPVLYPSVGIGLRRLTPIGPLRLELAVRPDRLGRLGQVFAGEQALADVLQVHFAVGAL
jgi:outer membrane protein assembly factor BamA